MQALVEMLSFSSLLFMSKFKIYLSLQSEFQEILSENLKINDPIRSGGTSWVKFVKLSKWKKFPKLEKCLVSRKVRPLRNTSCRILKNLWLPRWRVVSVKTIARTINFVRHCIADSIFFRCFLKYILTFKKFWFVFFRLNEGFWTRIQNDRLDLLI